MGVLDLFRKAKSPLSRKVASSGDSEDLFDDEFQRKLDYLAMVSRRVFSGNGSSRRLKLSSIRLEREPSL